MTEDRFHQQTLFIKNLGSFGVKCCHLTLYKLQYPSTLQKNEGMDGLLAKDIKNFKAK